MQMQVSLVTLPYVHVSPKKTQPSKSKIIAANTAEAFHLQFS